MDIATSPCVCVSVCVCMRVCLRVLSSFSLYFLWGGRRGWREAPSSEALPSNPGKRACIALTWALGCSWQGTNLRVHLHLISCYVIPLCLAWRRADHTPYGSSHVGLFCMLFLLSGIHGTKVSSHLRFHHHHQHHPVSLPTMTATIL